MLDSCVLRAVALRTTGPEPTPEAAATASSGTAGRHKTASRDRARTRRVPELDTVNSAPLAGIARSLIGMDVEHVPELVGKRVRLRELRDHDIARRASLGRNPEIARGFGEDLHLDEPMAEHDAADELARRFGPGPHWVIADQHDTFVGIVRLAPIDTVNRSARLGIGILDPARLGEGLGTESDPPGAHLGVRAPQPAPRQSQCPRRQQPRRRGLHQMRLHRRGKTPRHAPPRRRMARRPDHGHPQTAMDIPTGGHAYAGHQRGAVTSVTVRSRPGSASRLSSVAP